MENKKGIWIKAILALVCMIIMTAALLSAGAALVYYRELSARTAYIMIDAVYALVGLFGGFFAGKMMRKRNFLWGLAAGLVYFGCLMIVSLIVNGGVIADAAKVLIAFVLIVASAMIGGMVS